MKIGIMTFWWSEDNYGQLLQCYALQKYLHEIGHDAFLIRYNPGKDYLKIFFLVKMLKIFNLKKLINYLSYKKRVILSKVEYKQIGRAHF